MNTINRPLIGQEIELIFN